MFIGEERYAALRNEKKPADWREARRRIIDRMTAEGAPLAALDGYSTTDFMTDEKKPGKIPADIYAHHITIFSSGNESRVFASVWDQNDHRLACFSVLDTSAAGYSAAAACSGLFLELFNVYIDINF